MPMNNEINNGDIVSFGNTVCHVLDITPYYLFFDAYYTDESHSKMFINNFCVVLDDTPNISLVDSGMRSKFLMDLYAEGYGLRNGSCKLYKIPDLKPGSWVEIPGVGTGVFLDDQGDGFAVFGMIDSECGLDMKGLSMWKNEIKLLTVNKKKNALSMLESYGFVWDEANLQVVHSRPRAQTGTMYWHITDRFTIRAEQDIKTAKHNQRYCVGNYFLSPEEAQEALSVLLSYLGM